jgi:hypothetical protein
MEWSWIMKSELKDARCVAASIVQTALEKRVAELIQTDAFKELKAELEKFEDNGNPDNLRVDGDNLISSYRFFVPAELSEDGNSELIEELLKECSDTLYFQQDSYSSGYREWVAEITYGEPVIFNEHPERNCYAIYSQELGLKIEASKIIDEEHGYLLIENAMHEHGCFPDIVSTDSCGFAFYRKSGMGTLTHGEIKHRIAEKESQNESE